MDGRRDAGPVRRSPSLGAVVVLLLAAAPARGQLAPPGAGPSGLGGVATATARGPDALAENPAGLGLRGAGRYTIVPLPFRLTQGLAPVSLGDIGEWNGRRIPAPVKEAWLRRVEAEGSERGSAGVAASAFAVQVGPVGIQLTSMAGARARLTPDAVELLLFGNAGRTGEPKDFHLAGSELVGHFVTTLGIGYGRPVARWRDGRLAAGATLTWSVGHAVVVGRDVGSSFQGDPLEGELRLPVLVTDTHDRSFDAGHGAGVDVGLAWEGERFRAGLSVRNLVNTFTWDVDDLEFRPGTALFDPDGSQSDFGPRPPSDAPEVLRRTLAGLDFDPTLSLGAAWTFAGGVALSAHARRRFGKGMDVDPAAQAFLGVEARVHPRVPLRAHLGVVSGGFQAGGGASATVGPVTLSAAASGRFGGSASGTILGLSISIGPGS